MAENPYRAPQTKTDESQEPPRSRSALWYVLATIAAVTGLFAASGLLILLPLMILALVSDTSQWEMPPYAICFSLLLGSAPWVAVCLGCVAWMRRISR